MVDIIHFHGDVALGPFGFVKVEFSFAVAKQEKAGLYLLEFIRHVVLAFLIADARYLLNSMRLMTSFFHDNINKITFIFSIFRFASTK
jgi:hypothetical protein